MEDVIADRDLHEFFLLLEELEAHATLLLFYHVGNVARVVKVVLVIIGQLVGLVSNFVHNFEVDRHHSFSLCGVLVVLIFKLTVVARASASVLQSHAASHS